MERSRLICSLIGYYTGKNPSITAKDLQIQVDNHLLDSNLPILGSEKDDLEILSDLNDETFLHLPPHHVSPGGHNLPLVDFGVVAGSLYPALAKSAAVQNVLINPVCSCAYGAKSPHGELFLFAVRYSDSEKTLPPIVTKDFDAFGAGTGAG